MELLNCLIYLEALQNPPKASSISFEKKERRENMGGGKQMTLHLKRNPI